MGLPIIKNGVTLGVEESFVPISSKSVIWQGSDIACINLCKGDSVDEVVFKLATLLCQVKDAQIDALTIDYNCLTNETIPAPTTAQEVVQLIIDSICNLSNAPAPTLLSRLLSTNSAGYVVLPEELYYLNEDNDTVTQLSVSDFLDYVAEKLVILIAGLQGNTTAINDLNILVASIQVAVEALAVAPPVEELTIRTQCASGEEEGLYLPIVTAFQNFESTYCGLASVIGTPQLILNAIAKQLGNLSNLSQVSNASATMRDLNGWVTTPLKISDTINNLWLTLNDVRTGFQNYVYVKPSIPCVAIPAEDLVITVNEYGANVSWASSSTFAIEKPIGFLINVYEVADTLFTTPIYSKSISPNYNSNLYNQNVISELILVETIYVLTVTVVYSCGNSKIIKAQQVLRKDIALFSVLVEDVVSSEDIDAICTNNSNPGFPIVLNYKLIKSIVTLTMLNKITSIPTGNPNGDTDVVLKFEIISQEYTEPVYEYATITIPVNTTSVTYEYVREKYTTLVNGGCGSYVKTYNCGQSISDSKVQFESSVVICD